MPTSTETILSLKQKKYIFYGFVGVVLISVIGWSMAQVADMVVWFIASILISYILDPIIIRMESLGIERLWAILIIFISFFIILAIAVALLLPIIQNQFNTLIEFIGNEEARNQLIKKAETVLGKLQGFLPNIDAQTISEKSEEWISAGFSQLAGLLQSLLSMLLSLLMIAFILFFILNDGRKMKTFLISQVPNRYFEMSLNLVDKTDRQLGAYIRGQIFVALAIGSLSVLALWILGVPYYFFIGMFAGVANMIPYVGPVIGMLAGGSVSLFMFDSLTPLWGSYSEIWQAPVFIVGAFGLIQLIDNISISPVIVSKSVDLHPLAVFIAILVGGQLFGIIGMLIAIPTVGIIKVIIQEIIWHFKNYKLI